jgi:hypothetical protein
MILLLGMASVLGLDANASCVTVMVELPLSEGSMKASGLDRLDCQLPCMI